MKGRIVSILAYNKFTFGEQIVSQFVLFECKWLFSVIIFYFHKSEGEQDRFHTHAFNAFSVKLFGRYDEYILLDEKTGEYMVRPRTNVFQYFPRNSYHKIGKGTGCMTILFSGPWKKTWREYINGDVVQYKWNRKTDKKRNKMKIIFLDIDGVLNVGYPGHDDYGRLFHPEFVDNLKRIVDETGAKIVMSSTWRFAGLEKMKQMWIDRNLPGELIDVTVDCVQIVDEGRAEFYDNVERGHEVEQWLDEHPGVKNYVILDDDNDFLTHQRGNFVRTANNINHPDSIDIGYGLTNECTNKAIRILNG